MAQEKFRFLSGEDVRQALGMEQAIALMREAFVQLSAGEAVAPVRTHLDAPAYRGQALFMPAYLPAAGQIGLKVVTVHEQNPARGLPLIHALVLVFDAATGRPLALMDGEYLTALRTGAASGLATDVLARQDARRVAIFGAGVQGRTQLEAVCAVRPIERAYVVSRTAEKATAFAEAMSRHLSLDVVVTTPAEALRNAEIVCTATTSVHPVFAPEDVQPGTHLNGVGSYRPDMAEIPQETVCAAKVVVDHRPACLAEAGDLILPLRAGLIQEGHVYAELGEIVAGHKAGRTSDDEVTFFKSVGNAVQDLAAAGHVVATAHTLGLGVEVSL